MARGFLGKTEVFTQVGFFPIPPKPRRHRILLTGTGFWATHSCIVYPEEHKGKAYVVGAKNFFGETHEFLVAPGLKWVLPDQTAVTSEELEPGQSLLSICRQCSICREPIPLSRRITCDTCLKLPQKPIRGYRLGKSGQFLFAAVESKVLDVQTDDVEGLSLTYTLRERPASYVVSGGIVVEGKNGLTYEPRHL